MIYRTLRERLGMPTTAQRDLLATAEAAFSYTLANRNRSIEREDNLDERFSPTGRETRKSGAMSRAINRRYAGLTSAIKDTYERYGITPQEFRESAYRRVEQERVFLQRLASRNLRIVKGSITEREEWTRAGIRDVERNFLYQLYLEQLFDAQQRAISTSDVSFALYVAVKAALVALATMPDGAALLGFPVEEKVITGPTGLTQVYPYCEGRDAAVWLLDEIRVGRVKDVPVGHFISDAEYHVTGVVDAADFLLRLYSDAVRSEREKLATRNRSVSDSPLPDDLLDDSNRRVYAATRMQRAINAYQSDFTGRSAKSISKEYGVRYSAMLAELRLRGLTRTRGGDRKGQLGV